MVNLLVDILRDFSSHDSLVDVSSEEENGGETNNDQDQSQENIRTRGGGLVGISFDVSVRIKNIKASIIILNKRVADTFSNQITFQVTTEEQVVNGNGRPFEDAILLIIFNLEV